MRAGDLHPELDPDTWSEWGRRMRMAQGTARVDQEIFLRKQLVELLFFARAVAMFNISSVLRSSLFVPFDAGWNRYVNLVAMEVETMHNRMLGEPAATEEDLAHQWELSGLKRP